MSPLACDPEARFAVVLDSDIGKTPEPTFQFRFLTKAEWNRVSKFADGIEEGQSGAEILDDLMAVLVEFLVGWQDMTGRDGKPIPYDGQKMGELVTPQEMWDLYYKMLSSNRLDPGTAKNLPSPSPSDAADSDVGEAAQDGQESGA